MKWSLLILLAIFFAKISFASPQVPDYLVYKNDTIPTYNLLVEQFLQQREQDNGQLFGLSFRNSIDGELGGSFNCWRGYQAIYKIENDSLFVSDIIDCHTIKNFDKQTSKKYLEEIFKDKVKNNKVFVDWFSGLISFPFQSEDNKIIRWDGVFENIYLFETALEIDKGIINKISDVENYTDLKNGIDRLTKDSINSILFKEVQRYKWKNLDKCDCSEKYIITIGGNGKIANVIMPDYQTKEEIEEFWDTKKEYNYCIKSMKKALSKLQFDIIKRNGKPMEENVLLEIWFEENGVIENWTY
ncbi:hypothetical protein [uncultured Draconibacterium sp.]|uniref:hypothetical protein n=1 Tax=uncultured Draconibacterium sp. TaxID=1573823 RepID=UPI002AA75360|nr:hypothetical protein [uncultured Draconibacterium sp.]